MNTDQVVRAWKDENYRLSLSPSERSLLPQHPAGWIELSEEQLRRVAGGSSSVAVCPTTLKTSCNKIGPNPVPCP